MNKTIVRLAPALALALLAPTHATAQSLPSGQLLADHGFEPGTVLHDYFRFPGDPWIPGQWNAEAAEIVVSPANGVGSLHGTGMIRILETGGVVSQVSQIVDLRPWAARIDAGDVVMDISSWVNASRAGPTPAIQALAGASLTVVGTVNLVGGAQVTGFNHVVATGPLDADANSWQRINASLALPAGTRYIHFELLEGNIEIPADGVFYDTAVLSLRTSISCDWDDSGIVDTQDLFAFFRDYFAGDADVNADGPTDARDYFDFIDCFFASN